MENRHRRADASFGFAIETHRLTRRYGSRVAVNSLDLAIPSGQVTGLVGPNGAGKSTTIRMLLGLIKPTSGSATVLGRRIERDPGVLRYVGAMVEGPAFYPGLCGRDNLRVLAELGRLPQSCVDRALELVALTDRARDAVRSYSMGMRQRLGIAAALLSRPSLVILDEPTNGLDPAGIQEVRAMLRSLARDGTTVFVSSHNLAELERVCQEVVLLRAGRLIYQGSMAELLERRGSRLTGRPEIAAATSNLADLVRRSGYQAQVENGSVVVSAPASWSASLNRLAQANGITLAELQVEAPTLEDAFVALTAGDDAPETQP